VLKPQPAYSPELNRQERIGMWLRHVVTHHRWFTGLSAPVEAVRNFFRYLTGVKDQVRQLCGLKTTNLSLHHCRATLINGKMRLASTSLMPECRNA
jgi:hypothetical protein